MSAAEGVVPQGEAEPILSWGDLEASAGAGHRVRVPAARLKPGDVFVVRGPSGSGKTSVLRALLDGGGVSGGETVLIAGAAASRLADRDRHLRFAYLAQADALLPDEGALANCLIGEYRDSSSLERAADKLAALGIDDGLWSVPARLLSGGQRRRVALARTLVLDRDVGVFDEPTSGLDPETARLVAEELARPGRHGGRCRVVVTHDDEVARIAGTVLGMIEDASLATERLRPPWPVEEAAEPIGGISSTIYYTPGVVFGREGRRMACLVAPLILSSALVLGGTILTQSLGLVDVPFSRFVDMPRMVLKTILQGLVLEVVPLVVGLLFAGIGGASIAGKAATLATTGVLDTVRWLGRDANGLFRTPVIIASTIYLPIIGVLAQAAAVVGVGLVLVAGGLPLGGSALPAALSAAVAARGSELALTVVKVLGFGAVTSIVAYRIGAGARGGSDMIALAAARSVLVSSLAVVLLNALFAVF